MASILERNALGINLDGSGQDLDAFNNTPNERNERADEDACAQKANKQLRDTLFSISKVEVMCAIAAK